MKKWGNRKKKVENRSRRKGEERKGCFKQQVSWLKGKKHSYEIGADIKKDRQKVVEKTLNL